MSLLDQLRPRLVNVKANSDGSIQCGCPECIRQGGDSRQEHLRIWPIGSFNCSKAGPDDKDHNRAIRAYIRPEDTSTGSSPSGPIIPDVEYLDPDPRPEMETIYKEDMLEKLCPDYSYWTGRRISEDVLRLIGGGVAPTDEKSKMSARYVFPIRNARSQIIGWAGRLVVYNTFAPKWKLLFKTSKACWPWFLVGDEVKATGRAVIFESIGDWLECRSHGITGGLVCFGLHLSSPTVGYLIAANPRHIIISTNNDKIGKPESADAGNKAADKIRAKLLGFFVEDKISVRLPQTAKDWNEAKPEEVDAFKAELELLT